jgi:predicted transcriptional regulator
MSKSGDPVGSITEEFEILERHIRMLRTVKSNQPVGLIKLSEMTGIPKHKVRYSLKLLEQQGIIRATPEGAVVTDDYDEFMETVKVYVDGLDGRIDALRAILQMPDKSF